MVRTISEDRQPSGMYLLALTDMCQRFAFWGVANLLVLFLIQRHNYSDMRADHLFGIFTGLAFLLPILGGWIADKLNYRLTTIWGMFSVAIGCFLVATGNMIIVIIGLGFIVLGGSVFNPSIYALLGSIYQQKPHLRDAGFSIYYSIVNVGIFLAMFILGALGSRDHWNGAFLLAGVVQLMGFLPFRSAQKHFDQKIHAPIQLSKGFKKHPPLHSHEKKRLSVILILCLFTIIFWIAYNQGGSSMNIFALRYTDRLMGNFEMPASWLLASEPLYLMILAFPLAKLYLYLASRKLEPTPPVKTALSLFAIGVCFLIMAIGAATIPTGSLTAAISPGYLFSAYGLMALGEMLIAPIGLSLITHISPRRVMGMLIGVWYFCIGIAFYLGGMIAPWMSHIRNISWFFLIFVFLAFIGGGILFALSKRLNKMRHLQTL